MARRKDTGPYATWNVECLTVEDNHGYYLLNRKPPKGKQRDRLSDEIVKAVFLDDDLYNNIAAKYGIERFRVHCIKTKKYYRSITDKL
jgi:hypothetical protein